jgi:hypothetical protein
MGLAATADANGPYWQQGICMRALLLNQPAMTASSVCPESLPAAHRRALAASGSHHPDEHPLDGYERRISA